MGTSFCLFRQFKEKMALRGVVLSVDWRAFLIFEAAMVRWQHFLNMPPALRIRLLGYFAAGLLGIMSVWVVIGSPLGVLNGALMIDTDYPNAAAAFELFIRAPWHWPLGENPGFGGVNLFFSDGAPWFAFIAKGIYQLTGIALSLHWLVVINMVLWPVMAWRLVGTLHPTPAGRWLAVLLLTFNLIVMVRLIGAQHIALGSYWVVLWAMCAVPLVRQSVSWWRRWEFLLALGVAVWSHAYLGAMAALIILVGLVMTRRWWAMAWVIILPLLLLYAVGALQAESTPMGGAKAYGVDLAAFTKSLGWGVAGNLYDIHEPTQGDAILYLGTGVWWLVFACVVMTVWQRCLSPTALFGDTAACYRWWSMLLAASGLLLFAMSFDLRMAGHVWLRVDIPSIFLPLYESFRVTGRFAAPLAFTVVIVVAIWWSAWCLRLPKSVWWSVSLVAVVLQLADARHAGNLSPPVDWQASAAAQGEVVADVLGQQPWSGRVFKQVGFFELEEQRLLDYLLVQQGARDIRVAHGARLTPEAVEKRSGYHNAQRGDVVILRDDAQKPECRRYGVVKQFGVCLL
jgi:hypothetical protein